MMRVLDFGPLDKLLNGSQPTLAIGPHDKTVRQVKKHGQSELTHPSIAFVPHRKGKVE